MIVYKNKGILFGGVFDDEGPRHSMVSHFYSDLYAFDMERRRWYQLGLKRPKKVGADKATRRRVKDTSSSSSSVSEAAGAAEGDEDDLDEEDEAHEDLKGDPPEGGKSEEDLLDEKNTNCFGFIDEAGNVVYMDLEEDVEEEEEEVQEKRETLEGTDRKVDPSQELLMADIAAISLMTQSAADESASSSAFNASFDAASLPLPPSATATSSSAPLPPSPTPTSLGAASAATAAAAAVTVASMASSHEPIGSLSTFFLSRTQPCSRINPCLVAHGSTIYIYGGVTELGDVEVTLDDCWSIDLGKRDVWKKVLQGSMHDLVWKGEDLEGTDGTRTDDDDEDGDGDDDDDDDEDDEENDENGEHESAKSKHKGKKSGSKKESRDGLRLGRRDEAEHSNEMASSAPSGDVNDEAHLISTRRRERGDRGGGGGGGGGIREKIASLRSSLGLDEAETTPLSGEALRQFYSRTSQYWSQQAISKWHEKKDASGGDGEVMSEKEVKREGFALCEARYNELLPSLASIWELEAQQREVEDEQEQSQGRGAPRKSGSRR